MKAGGWGSLAALSPTVAFASIFVMAYDLRRIQIIMRFAMILERTDQAISATDLQRQGKTLLDRLQNGDQDKYVIMRDNKPACVMLPMASYEALMDELEDMRIDAIAAERAASFDPAKAISHADMLKKYGSEP
jgi:antitoxin StbD